MGWLDDTGDFFRDMFHHWVGIVSGIFSILTALFQLCSPSYFAGDNGLTHSRVLFVLLSVVAFFLACRSAWKEKQVALNKSVDALNSAIDTNHPEVTVEFTIRPTNNTYVGGGPQVQIINRGSGDAWCPQIEDAVIGDYIVSFNCPSILEKGKPCAANCFIKEVDINSSNGLERLLRTGARADREGSGPWWRGRGSP